MDFYPDLFSPEALLTSLSNAQYIPGQLGADGVFDTQPQTGTVLNIPIDPKDSVAYEGDTARGAPAAPMDLEKRDAYKFEIKAMRPKKTPILADSVLNSGSPDLGRMTVTRLRDRATSKLRKYVDLNHEYRRMAVINSPTNVIGSAPAAVKLAFAKNDEAMRQAVHIAVKVPMESALDGLPYSGLTAYCSETYWQAFISSASVEKTYLNYAAAAEMRSEPAESFFYAGVTWKRYREGGGIAITAGQAKVIPMGLPEPLFIQAFAPDDTMQSVGEGLEGQPYYLNVYPIDEDKGLFIKISSYPLMICTRPTAVLTLKLID